MAHIRNIVTDDRQTRKGAGRALLSHIIAQTSSQGLRRLACLSTLTAVPFYEAMGFEAVQPISVPLAPGISFPALEMTRDL